jgi:CHAD domain-containing protein
MAYRFDGSDKSVKAALRRIAAEQVDGALCALQDEGRPMTERVHEARKAVKKLRGLIRIVRPVFPDYHEENSALRAAGRKLSALREAEVAHATIADLAEAAGIGPAAETRVAGPAIARHEDAHADEALAERLEGFATQFRALADRAGRWKCEAKGFDALAPGLEASWEKARQAMDRACRTGKAAHIHTWRKRAKDHWYQARLLRKIWPEMMAPHVAAAHRLGDLLGQYNDITEVLGDLSAQTSGNAARVADEALSRQAALLDEAVPLGRLLLAGPPEGLSGRWRGWWQVWRA